MIRQRPVRAAPAVQGPAEGLPLRTGAVDAVLAVLTVHHWTDLAAGVAEMRRVTGRRVVILT
jgi:ubiquinone/menaquinone biosynthesis C-methylase UbiE